MSEYTTTNTTSLTLEKFNTEPVMTIHPDGRVTVSDKFQPDEAAAKVVEAFKTRWMADVQATKIRELQSNVTQLENRLRALWDKLEGERKHYMERIVELENENERINRLERAGDMLCAAAAFLGWHGEIEQWNKVKGQKP